MFAVMTIKELYRRYLDELQKIYSLNEAAVITDWAFDTLIHTRRSDIMKNPELQVSKDNIMLLNDTLAKLLQHTPVQYVLGEGWFYNMKLKINNNVFIPRPETEELVNLAVDNTLSELNLQPAILDIGTGSGCIAIALKTKLPAALITAVDISKEAIEVAKENAASHKTNIEFMVFNFLAEEQWPRLSCFDIIISNPPYIPDNEKEKLDKNVVGFEPHTALFVPHKTPLLFYEKIALFGKTHLNAGAKIYVETHEDLAKETAAVFTAIYSEVKIIKDLFDKERMVIAVNG